MGRDNLNSKAVEQSSTSTLQNIPNFFSGRCIFITGATGFIGKVLVEKLLRSCPNVGTIYLLIRPKKGRDVTTRIEDIIRFPLFDKLKRENPNSLQKLHPIRGDVSEENLGMSCEDRQLLQERVSVVFHVAATVKFDAPLEHAVLVNVRGTREMVNLATGMKHLTVFIHASTAYTFTLQDTIEERLYDAPMDWRTVIQWAETEDPFTIRLLTHKIIGLRPNTYTLAKALAEHVINDYRNQLPVVIFRPSVVLSSAVEPMPGWIDSFNGPMALAAGAGKGILYVYYTKPDNHLNIVPVDVACKGLIIASWYEAQTRKAALPVYNGTFGALEDFTMDGLVENAYKTLKEVSFEDAFYYPWNFVTNNLTVYYLGFTLFQFLPALLADFLLYLTSGETKLMKLQRRVFTAATKLNYFIFNEWEIENTNFLKLESCLLPEDDDSFRYKFTEQSDMSEYYYYCALGTRRYLFLEDDKTLPEASRRVHRLYILHIFLRIAACLLLFWILFTYSLPQKCVSAFISALRAILTL